MEIIEGSNFLHRLADEIFAAAATMTDQPIDGDDAEPASPSRDETLPHHGDDVQWWDYARVLHGEDARVPRRRTHTPQAGDCEVPPSRNRSAGE